MTTIDFESRVTLRLKASLLEEIRKHVEKHSQDYYNLSHYIRACVIKDLRGEQE